MIVSACSVEYQCDATDGRICVVGVRLRKQGWHCVDGFELRTAQNIIRASIRTQYSYPEHDIGYIFCTEPGLTIKSANNLINACTSASVDVLNVGALDPHGSASHSLASERVLTFMIYRCSIRLQAKIGRYKICHTVLWMHTSSSFCYLLVVIIETLL